MHACEWPGIAHPSKHKVYVGVGDDGWGEGGRGTGKAMMQLDGCIPELNISLVGSTASTTPSVGPGPASKEEGPIQQRQRW